MDTQSTFIRVKDAPDYLGFGRTLLQKTYETDPTFPRKIRISTRCAGWRIEDLDRWLESRAAQAQGAQR